MCWPSEKQFTETKLQPENEEAMAWNPDQEELWRHIGSDVVEGIHCDVYERWRTAFSRVCGKIWVDTERQVRVRQINVNRVGELVLQCDFRNVQIGPPDPSLFEVPSGYTRFEVPGSS